MQREYTTGGHYVIVGGEGAVFCSADTPADIVKRLYGALVDERGAEGVMRAILALDHSAISSLGVVVRGAETWHVLVAGVAEAVVFSAGEERSIHAPDVLTWSEVTVARADAFRLGEVGAPFDAGDALPFEGGVVRADVLSVVLTETGSDAPAPAEMGAGKPGAAKPVAVESAGGELAATVAAASAFAASPVASAPLPGDDPAIGPAPGAHIVLSTGRVIELDRPVLFGRAPRPSIRPELSGPRLVTLPRASADVSRTHLLVDVADGLVAATDLGSRNGTVVTRPDGESVRLAGGEKAFLERGARFELGDGVYGTVEFSR